MTRRVLTALALLSAAGLAAPGVGHAQAFKVEKFDIKGEGGTDYVAVEAATGRVFVSRSTHMMVVEGATGKVLGDIPNTPGVHATTAWLLLDDTSDYTVLLARYFRERYNELGGEIVGEDTYAGGTLDFSDQIARILALPALPDMEEFVETTRSISGSTTRLYGVSSASPNAPSALLDERTT